MVFNSCAVHKKKNLGLSKCGQMPGLIKGMIETPPDFKVETEEDLLSLDFWNQAALADENVRIYYWPKFRTFENVSTEAVYEETPLDSLAVFDGKYAFRVGIKESLCTHKAMFTHRGSGNRLILIDHENKFIGTEGPNGEFMGLLAALVNTEKLLFNDGSVSSKSPVYIVLEDNTELDERGAMFKAPFVNGIYRIVDAKIVLVGNPTTGAITVRVVAECDETPINGLLPADFVNIGTDGSTNPATAAAPDPNIPGQYALTGTFEDGVLTLAPAEGLTVKPYEGIPVTIDVTITT